MVILKDTQKALNKILHSFLTITLNKVSVEGMYLNIIKAIIYKKLTATVLLNSEKLKGFPLKSGQIQECPFCSLLFNTVWQVVSEAIRQEKKYI